MLTSVVMD